MIKNQYKLTGRNRSRTYFKWNTYHPDDLMPQKGYVIHHKNRNFEDESFDNLQKMTHKEHAILHSMGKENPMYGKHLSEETKDKISKKCKGKIISVETRTKYKTGNYTQRELAKEYNISFPAMNSVLKNKTWVGIGV